MSSLPSLLSSLLSSLSFYFFCLFYSQAFESLNSKMRLYSKDVFIEQHHRFTLLRTLLYVLLAKTHDNLRDELIITIYNIAAVDFDSFFKQVSHTYISQLQLPLLPLIFSPPSNFLFFSHFFSLFLPSVSGRFPRLCYWAD